MSDICPYLCSFKSNSGFCNRTGGYDGCQYRKILGYDYKAKRFYVEPVDSYEEACGLRSMTIGDRIRQMTDEELAEFLSSLHWGLLPKSKKGWLDWLLKETDG